MPLDTSVDADAAQHEVYLRMGGAGRVAVAFRLSAMTRRIAMAGIRGRHPGYTDAEVQRAYARLVLGDALVRAAWPGHALLDP